MTTPVGMPNYQQLGFVHAGAEIIRGTKAPKTNKWYGQLVLNRRQPLAESDEFAGTFFSDYTKVRGAVLVDGTYNQQMAYEDAHLFRYAVQGRTAGVSDGNTTPGYEHPFRYSPTRDDLDTASVEYSRGGLIYESEGLLFPEFTISSDIDDAQAVWKWSSRAIAISRELKAGRDDVVATGGTTTTFVKTGWALTVDALIGSWAHFKSGTAGNVDQFREILDNDATSITVAALPSAVAAGDVIDVYAMPTAGIADRERETIKGPGTRLWLLDKGDTPDDTNYVRGRFISFSVTGQLNAAYKRFSENVSRMSNKVDLGRRRVTGQVRLEFDRRREWDKYVDLDAEYIRIRQTGSTIDAGAGTTKSATIDVFDAAWDDPTEDVRGNNVTVTFPFRGFVDSTEGTLAEFAIVNKLSSLLA